MSDTDQDFERRVRDRAYHLWEAAGSPEGDPDAFWHRARELEEALRRGGEAGEATGVPASQRKSGVV